MKTPAIVLSLIASMALTSFQSHAIAQDECASSSNASCGTMKEVARDEIGKCSAAIADLQAKNLIVKAARENHEHNKSRINTCKYLRFQMEYLVEASRAIKLCEPFKRPVPASLVEQSQDLLQRAKALQRKHCAQADRANAIEL